jgi:hypothetical protein
VPDVVEVTEGIPVTATGACCNVGQYAPVAAMMCVPVHCTGLLLMLFLQEEEGQ